MLLQPISQVVAQPVVWLWQSRLGQGKLAILDGDPGLGKSLLALDLCARLSRGRPFPDDTPGPGVCSSIVLNAEDANHDTVRPRLQAAGADLDRVLVLSLEDVDGGRLIRLPSEIGKLDAYLTKSGARLVVIDPLFAYLDAAINVNSDQAIRRALLPLAQLADKHGCVILLIRHLNKELGFRAVYRGGGSIGVLAACRSGWLVAADPEDATRCVLAQLKNNLAPRQPSLAYSVEGAGTDSARLCWHGTSPFTADQLLAARPTPSASFPRDRACDFLADFLANGPRLSRDLWEAARQEGLSERTLYRARQALQVRMQRISRDGQVLNYWLLPDQQLPASETSTPPVPDLEEWLAPLRQRFPPLTPLDDL